jgi:DNA-binding protein H-NS
MSIDTLSKLKRQVESALASKVAETRRMLESKLAELTGVGTKSPRRGGTRGKVRPKYRNPDNPSETWAGRGLKPRWLTAALKAGKKLEHFSIAARGKKSPNKTRKTKAKAVRKATAKKTRKPRATMRPRPAPASSPSPADTAQA